MNCLSAARHPAGHTNAKVILHIGHGARIHQETCVDRRVFFRGVERGEGTKGAYHTIGGELIDPR